jgi:hypothetical protein
MNKNIFLQNLAKSKINNTSSEDYMNNVAQVINLKPKSIINNNDISDNIINVDKYNPDVMSRYKNLNRINNYEFTNNCYKPITSSMPTTINNPNDLIIHSNDDKSNNITERYNLLYNQRMNELNKLKQSNQSNQNNSFNNINLINNNYTTNTFDDNNNNHDFNSIKIESNTFIKSNQLLDSNYEEIFKRLNNN